MSLINCPECDKSVSDTATNCIHCGYILNKPIKGKLSIYGYREAYLMSPKVKVYLDGNFVGDIKKGGLLELEITQNSLIEFKCNLRKNSYQASKDRIDKIQLGFNRISGSLDVHVIDTATF